MVRHRRRCARFARLYLRARARCRRQADCRRIARCLQTDGEGFYDVQRPGGNEQYARGRFTTGADGCYGFRTVRPVSYPVPTDGPVGKMLLGMGRHPYRPAHVHVIATAPGYDRVATHLFVEGDEYLDSDAVFGVKHSLVVEFRDRSAGPTPDGRVSLAPFCTADFDFKLVRT